MIALEPYSLIVVALASSERGQHEIVRLSGDEAAGCEDGQEAHQLNECESNQHLNLKLTDCFRLSRHALKSAITNQTETQANAEDRDTESYHIHVCFVFLLCSFLFV